MENDFIVSLKKDSRAIGFALLAQQAVSQTLPVALYLIISLALGRGARLEAVPGAENLYAVADMVSYSVGMLLGCLLLADGRPCGLVRPPRGSLALALGVFFAIFYPITWLNNLIDSLFETVGVASYVGDISVPEEPLALTLLLLSTVLLPALLEELLFRGLLLGRLRRYGDRFAILAVSLLFAAMHATLSALPGIFLLSIAFCWVDIAAGSLLPSMLMHFINNGVAVYSWYLEGRADGNRSQLLFWIIMLLCIAGMAGVAAFLRFRRIRPAELLGEERGPTGAFWRTAPMLALLAVLGGLIIYITVVVNR